MPTPDSPAIAAPHRIAVTLFLVALWAVCSGTLSAAGQPSTAPNILFVFADDMSYNTIHALGNSEVRTPNLDRLAQAGTTFTHAYNMGAWHGAVCVASRTSLNTGRTVWHARDIEPRLGEEVRAGRLWAQQLAAAGYATYMSGKWHVSTDARNVFQNTVHIRPGMPGTVPEAYQRPVAGQPDSWQPWDPQNGGFWEGGRHWSEVLADDAQDFLQQAGRSDQPFFMYLAFNAPHDPRQSPKEFVDQYPTDQLALPESFLPEYPYMEEIGCGQNLRDERLAPWPRTPHAVRIHRQEYYALITHMDAQIGRILQTLEASGKAENTFIFFTADHGLAVGHHGLMGKQNMYEHSMRAPLIVVGPGIPRDRRINTRVYLQDIMPTTLELAGVSIPPQVEFKSLLPLISGKRTRQYDAIYGAYLVERQRMIVRDQLKLIVYPKAGVRRLYDLGNDPAELHDLAGDPEWAAQLAELETALAALQQQMDDPLLSPQTN